MGYIDEQANQSECQSPEDVDPKLRDIIRSLARMAAEKEFEERRTSPSGRSLKR
ncbi:hypothetical protein [Maricaulis parjimensis]|uniref:hypothetical protein n=1 Tax=Maricaulis parjimensis TaxID=144023 RepID=UPI001EEDCDFA|nr:hypothetical protein [Maricaulis parjimensis]